MISVITSGRYSHESRKSDRGAYSQVEPSNKGGFMFKPSFIRFACGSASLAALAFAVAPQVTRTSPLDSAAAVVEAAASAASAASEASAAATDAAAVFTACDDLVSLDDLSYDAISFLCAAADQVQQEKEEEKHKWRDGELDTGRADEEKGECADESEGKGGGEGEWDGKGDDGTLSDSGASTFAEVL